jgi:hypothetical protein
MVKGREALLNHYGNIGTPGERNNVGLLLMLVEHQASIDDRQAN